MPTFEPTGTPVPAPIMYSATKTPGSGSSAYYEFSTSGGTLPTLNAQTPPPNEIGPTSNPTPSPSTYFPTLMPTYLSTLSPTYYPTSGGSEEVTNSPHGMDDDDCANQTDTSDGNFTGVSGDFVITNEPSTTYVPISDTDTAAPTTTPTSPDTDFPTNQDTDTPTQWPTWSPVLVVNAATSGPTISTNSSENDSDSQNGDNNATEPCLSAMGDFFIARERHGNASSPLHEDILSFAYELETAGRNSLDETLPYLEAEFVNAILHVLFPSECHASSVRHMRFLQAESVVGVRSTPADQIIEGKIVVRF